MLGPAIRMRCSETRCTVSRKVGACSCNAQANAHGNNLPRTLTRLLSHIALWVLLPVAPVLAQQYNFRNYSVADGLAQSQVYDLVEDLRGYIWMGTRGGGLSRFDIVSSQAGRAVIVRELLPGIPAHSATR